MMIIHMSPDEQGSVYADSIVILDISVWNSFSGSSAGAGKRSG